MLGPDEIEAPIRERQRRRVALDEARAVGEAAALGQQPGRSAKIRAEIDAGYRDAMMADDPARRAAEPGAEIEHRLARPESGERGKLLGRGKASRMELVGRRQVGGVEPPRVLAGARQDGKDLFGNIRRCVVAPDRLRVAHRRRRQRFAAARSGRASSAITWSAPRMRL